MEIKGKLYPAYEGPVELSVQVEHVTRGNKTYAVIEVKYGDRVARVELNIEELRRAGLLHNLAAIMTDDQREFYKGYVLHGTSSYFQAAERLLMWAIFMPGEYKITVRRVYATKEGLSPQIEIESRFGLGGIEKIEKSLIHRLVLRLARELAGGENLNEVKDAASKILAASWLMISAILNAPEGGRPSEGLAVLVEKGVLPGIALDRLRPIFEELDALLGAVSRKDKAYLVGKMVDYDGSVNKGLLKVGAKKIKKMTIELDGVEIHMADVAEAAAEAFWKEGGWSGDMLYFGPAKGVPELDDVPTLKYFAMLMEQKTHKEAKELRQKDLVSRVELAMYKGSEAKFKIIAAKAKEGERVPITRKNLEKIWKGFKDGKFTHLRLVVGGEKYELSSISENGMRFTIGGERAQKLAEALKEELKLNVEPTSNGYLYLYREDLEALLSKGVEAYAVRKAKKGEAMWRVEITSKGRTIALEMTYIERQNRLQKGSSTGKIEATIYEEGASEGER
ncbi:MAG: hypothetical protein JZD41_05480, partial [Thermoproteus sp.]|nr:hypothetical protein [Thermoproteus sp.]